MTGRLILWTGIAAAALWASGAPAAVQHTGLADWIAGDAGPFFAERLSTHPRFKGERIGLAALDGLQVPEAADGLTVDIQRRLAGMLLERPGVRLAWPRAGQDPAPATYDGLDCPMDADVSYLLGVTVEAAGPSVHRVSLNVLDLHERVFVSGASRQWQGRLSASEHRALTDSSQISARAGTRTRPFRPDEADFMAATLARELGCALSDRRAGDVDVFVGDPGAADSLPSAALVASYLAARREIRLVPDRGDADLELLVQRHDIDADLAQVWFRLSPVAADAGTPAAAAEIYVRGDRPSPAAPVRFARAETDARTAPVPVQPSAAGSLLSVATVVVPRHPALCRTRDPWRRGAVAAPDAGDVSAAGCFAVEIESRRAAQVYVVGSTPDGALVRVPVAGCEGDGWRRNLPLSGAGRLRFPAAAVHGGNGALPVLPGDRFQTLILLADSSRSATLGDRVARLPSACAPDRGRLRIDRDQWIDDTEALMASLGADADWRAVRIRHARRGTGEE